MATEFEIVAAEDTYTHVTLRGPLDISGASAVSLKFTAATAARKRHVIVDMSGVDFVASIGMGMLVQVARALMADGKRVVLVAPTGSVASVFRASKLDSIMPITESVPAALNLLQ